MVLITMLVKMNKLKDMSILLMPSSNKKFLKILGIKDFKEKGFRKASNCMGKKHGLNLKVSGIDTMIVL